MINSKGNKYQCITQYMRLCTFLLGLKSLNKKAFESRISSPGRILRCFVFVSAVSDS